KKNALPMRKKLKELKKYLIKQQEELKILDSEADRKSNTLNKIYHEYNNIVNNLRLDREKLEEGTIKNLKQVEQLEKDAQVFKEKTLQKEEELKELIDELEEFDKTLKDIGMRISKGKREYTKIKSEYDKQAGEIQIKYD